MCIVKCEKRQSISSLLKHVALPEWNVLEHSLGLGPPWEGQDGGCGKEAGVGGQGGGWEEMREVKARG